MKIAKAKLVSPGSNDTYAALALALSVFVFAYSLIFGQKSILLFYALWLPLLLVDPGLLLRETRRSFWLFVFPAFACFSTFWSAAPGTTLRAGVQYFSLVVCALIASKIVSMSALTRGMVVGVALVLGYSLVFGHFSYDPMDATYSFVGAFASKNQLGFYASLGILFGIAAILLARPGDWLSLVWLGVVALSAYSLMAAHSATSVLSIAAAVLMMFGMGALFAFPSRDRQVVFGFGLFLLVLVVSLGASGAAEGILGLVGKDTTLTGRTYLWSEGLSQSQSAPLLGMGYRAFWTQGFAHAEQLWAEFFITERAGFHFHNTYIETLVGLGYVGVLILVLLVAGALFGNLLRLLTFDGSRERLILFSTTLLLVIRSFFEIDFLTPYTIGGFLLYYSASSVLAPRPIGASLAAADDDVGPVEAPAPQRRSGLKPADDSI